MSTVAADPLSTPLELPCGARLGNRLAKAAMSEQLGDRGNAPTDELARLYARWGAGGAGLLITGNVMVSRGHLGEPRNVVVDDARDLVALRAWAAAARAGGAACWVQINHPGRQAARGLGEHCVAPSAVALKLGPLFATPRPLADAEIEALIAAYARTARIVVAAGFDGVQLHAAHGYLVSQFLSPLTNRRTDRWGGPLEHRMRFALRCVEAMRAAVGPDVPVSVKLNSADFQRGGFSEEESVEVVGALAGAGVDLLEISGGTYERPAMSTGLPTSTAAREAYFLDYAERVREVAPALPLMVTGGFRTAAGMRAALAGGATDVVGLARPLATVPEACAELLAAREVPLPSHRARLGVPALDPAIDTAWHTRQLQRMGRGEAPRSDEPAWRTAIATVVDNGWSAFRRRRGVSEGVHDVLGPGLRLLFCGINPGLRSAELGLHFARPGNRFWPALALAGVTPRRLRPEEQSLLPALGAGITNLCPRPTRRADELSAAELRAGAVALDALVAAWTPRAVAIVGVSAYRTAFGLPRAALGPQAERIGGRPVWVLPNPSGLNAHHGLAELGALYAHAWEAAG